MHFLQLLTFLLINSCILSPVNTSNDASASSNTANSKATAEPGEEIRSILAGLECEPLHKIIMDTRIEKDNDTTNDTNDTNDDYIGFSNISADIDDSMNEVTGGLAMGAEASSSRSSQFFPSATQKKLSKKRTPIKPVSDTASDLRTKLVEHEIGCLQKLNDKKILIAEDEHKARMALISTQSLAAEAQISFWLAACAAITDFSGQERATFDGMAQVVQTAVLADSMNQSQHANPPPDV